jgi:small GTP-binding protein
MNEELDYMIKIILVGDSCVGKTAYFNRLQKKKDSLSATTIGVDYCSIKKYYDDKYVKINIWDTAGQERFNTIITTYFKEIAGIVLMFNVNEPTSIHKLEQWIRHVKCHTNCCHDYEHPILLLGNKNDKINNTNNEELNQFIQDHNITYKEISCRNDPDEYLEEVFDLFIRKIVNEESNSMCKGIKSKDTILGVSAKNKIGNNRTALYSPPYSPSDSPSDPDKSNCCIIS